MPNNPNGPSQDEKNDKKDIKKLGSENMTVELSSLSFSLSLSFPSLFSCCVGVVSHASPPL